MVDDRTVEVLAAAVELTAALTEDCLSELLRWTSVDDREVEVTEDLAAEVDVSVADLVDVAVTEVLLAAVLLLLEAAKLLLLLWDLAAVDVLDTAVAELAAVLML